MKDIISCLGALVVAGIIAITVVGAAQASSATGAATLPNISIPDAGITPAHCRRYYHCHRECKRRWYGKRKCREYCHRC